MEKMEKVFGYAGKILRVNLSNGGITTEPTLPYAEEWLGGPGIAVKMLYDELRPWVTPYDPANRLIIGAGALVGTTAPGANKMNISTLGPMTGGWASSCSDSYIGGQLKRAGYDSVVIHGRAHRPVYLWICDKSVEIRDASKLWGKTTWETLEAIRDELGDPKLHVLSIGPAGENLVRGACVIHDRGRAFGRGGTGAVMGSKNLKAVVAKGRLGVRVADPERFMSAVAKCRAMFKKTPSTEKFHKYGTLGIMEGKQAVCGIPYKNFQDTHLPEDMAFCVDPKHLVDKYQVSKQSYPGCAFGGCSRIMHVTEGPYAGLVTESNQWEVVATLQGRLAIREPAFMLMANTLCNQSGLDVDAAGASIGWAMECFQRGIIDEKDTDGVALRWGDHEVSLALIRKMVHRDGFGDLLAEGCARAADILGRGSGYYAIHIKGLDLYESCRGAMGWSLGATTSTRGGGHTTGGAIIETIGGLDVEKAREVYGIDNPHKPQEYEGKARMVYFGEALQRVNNCLGVCHYNTSYFDPNLPSLPELAELYSAATGLERGVEDLKRITMKQVNLEKALNLRFTDFDRKDDMPPPRDLAEPILTGNLAGLKIDPEKYAKMLDEYYDLHGWDRATSFPTRKALVDLGLAYVAEDLEKIGKLG
jgi:aldehyde:ferredoxin oxidoreductase